MADVPAMFAPLELQPEPQSPVYHPVGDGQPVQAISSSDVSIGEPPGISLGSQDTLHSRDQESYESSFIDDASLHDDAESESSSVILIERPFGRLVMPEVEVM